VDFLEGVSAVTALFDGDGRNADDRESTRSDRLESSRPPGLSEAVAQGYDGISLPRAADENIKALNQPDTLAVVTGQQTGLFGGPLFTFYKALSAVYLAEVDGESRQWVFRCFWDGNRGLDFSEIDRIAFPPALDSPDFDGWSIPRDWRGARSAAGTPTRDIHPIRENLRLAECPAPQRGLVTRWEFYRRPAAITRLSRYHERTPGRRRWLENNSTPPDPPMVERSRDFWRYCLAATEIADRPICRHRRDKSRPASAASRPNVATTPCGYSGLTTASTPRAGRISRGWRLHDTTGF
jgi:hypothetical protein